MSTADSQNLFTARAIEKSFPGVRALSEVSLDLQVGEVHALVGENGAGKSTLTRIFAGVENADGGQMTLQGQGYQPLGRADAESQGVRMVMQELNLVGNLSIAENIFIDRLPKRLGFVRYAKLHRDARGLMEQVGLGDFDPQMSVRRLGVGQQQMVEIAAGLCRRCRMLILDEPTASLTDHEADLLFGHVRKLQSQGVGIIYISHRIEEVMQIADRITVLRDGRLVATRRADKLNIGEVVRLMVGRPLGRQQLDRRSSPGNIALRVDNLCAGDKVKKVSFEVRKSEIFGVAGLMGSGRTETMRAVFGADRIERGRLYLYGENRPASIRNPRDAVRKGLALLTEDRKDQGLLLPLSVRVNISLTGLSKISRCGLISRSLDSAVAQKYIAGLGIRCASMEHSARQLSGGNQQKVVIAKWLYRNCDIMIFDEPTRGIDVGAKFEIYNMLADLAEQGKALIVVSSDLKELMAVSDRIMVMSAGRVAGIFARGDWDEETLMSAAFSEYIDDKSVEGRT